MPLVDRDRSVPESHEGCVLEPCVECQAARYLVAEDRRVLWFYQRVSDQLVLLSPIGLQNGKQWLAPRLEAWESACRIYGVPESERAQLIDCARVVHVGLHSDAVPYGLFAADPEDLMPPGDDCGA